MKVPILLWKGHDGDVRVCVPPPDVDELGMADAIAMVKHRPWKLVVVESTLDDEAQALVKVGIEELRAVAS